MKKAKKKISFLRFLKIRSFLLAEYLEKSSRNGPAHELHIGHAGSQPPAPEHAQHMPKWPRLFKNLFLVTQSFGG